MRIAGEIMPEIPEMEIYKNYLNQWVRGKTIREVIVLRPKSINIPTDDFINNLTGVVFGETMRRGKYLINNLSNNMHLLSHMMLDGRLYYLPSDIAKNLVVDFNNPDEIKKRVEGIPGKPNIIFLFSDGSILFFCHLTLGYLHYLNQEELDINLAKLGADPLSENFLAEDFRKLISGKRGMIKPWLMNQKYLAGVGNAYSNEALFGARILPTRQIKDIKDSEKIELFNTLVTTLKDSINKGGDMEESFTFEDSFTGGYNQYFMVYDREGEPCKVCSNLIIREEVGGRNAFYCPHCQR